MITRGNYTISVGPSLGLPTKGSPTLYWFTVYGPRGSVKFMNRLTTDEVRQLKNELIELLHNTKD